MIYIIGDSHGDINHFSSKTYKINKVHPPRKGDTVIVCGDFGFIWDDSEKERKILTALGKKNYNILFVPGTHENYNILDKYEESFFMGGKAKTICGNVRMLCNGYIFNIEGKKIFTFGGGESDDKVFKKAAKNWYPQEMPTEEQLNFGKNTLINIAKSVDYIVTHDAPTRIRNFINDNHNQMNQLHAFFDWIMENCKYRHWFFGKYHLDRRISPTFSAVFKKPLAITSKLKKIQDNSSPKSKKSSDKTDKSKVMLNK